METKRKESKKYLRFLAMIGTSMLLMFLLMYVHSYQIINHFWFSETRLFMTMLMGGAMVIVMLLFMLGMYKNRLANIFLFTLGLVLMVSSIWLVRSQLSVSDTDYMEGMIPHHSIAILTSKRAQIKDPRVRALADEIIKAQRKEIMEMQWLIQDIEAHGIVKSEEEKALRPVPNFEASLEAETISLENDPKHSPH